MELSQNEKFMGSVFNKALIPCILAMLSTNINVVVDGILVGNMIGQDALAAINLSLPYYLFLCVIGSFFGYGSSTEASLCLGANKKDTAILYFRTGITLLLISSVIFTVLSLIFLDPIVSVLCSESAIRPFVREYVLISAIGVLPKLMIYIPYGYLRLDGRNVEVMLMMGIMAVVNVVLDVAFVAGLGMGVFGAGLASVISTALVFVLGFIWLFDKKSSFKPALGIIKNRTLLNKMLSSGGPFALTNSFSTLRIIIINWFLLQMGGGLYVAIYTAVNGIAGFAEGITLGIPQAGSAIMGVCKGEGDTESMMLLFKRMIKTGFIMILVFGALIVIFYDPIAKAYAIDANLRFPLIMLSISLYPTLFFNVLQNYYNIIDKDFFADFIIFFRLFAMVWGSLWICSKLNISPWLFLVISEAGSLIVWAGLCAVIKKFSHSKESLFLFNPDMSESEEHSLNFSVADSDEDICNASERIGDFCSENGMTPKQTMRLSMSIEEILQLVKKENPMETLDFDLRAICVGRSITLRFRYDGKDFNPFNIPEDDPDDKYMGVMMIQNLVSKVTHFRTFGTNTVQVILEDR